MATATIYSMDGDLITEGVQSETVSNEVVRMAKRMAAERGESVVVEDHGTREIYEVTPEGEMYLDPDGFEPTWSRAPDAAI